MTLFRKNDTNSAVVFVCLLFALGESPFIRFAMDIFQRNPNATGSAEGAKDDATAPTSPGSLTFIARIDTDSILKDLNDQLEDSVKEYETNLQRIFRGMVDLAGEYHAFQEALVPMQASELAESARLEKMQDEMKNFDFFRCE